MASACPADLIALAHHLANASGEAIRPHFRAGVPVETKDDDSPVTIADREAEQAIRALITHAHPDHGIVGEEHGTERVDAEYVWVIDPIDGTKSFITGTPMFGTLIGLVHRGCPILGVIDQPITGERWIGAAGHGTKLDGKPVHVRACADLARAVLFTTSPELLNHRPGFARLRSRVGLIRYSADCYAEAVLATGFADLVVEDGLKVYDYIALIPVIEGAGGIVTDWGGSKLGLASDGSLIAAGDRAMHAAALELLRG